MRLRGVGTSLAVSLGLAGVISVGIPASPAHGGTTTVTGTVEQRTRLARTNISLDCLPGVAVYFNSYGSTYGSRDPGWNGAQVFLAVFYDPSAPEMRDAGRLRGHMAIVHPGGDQTFLAVEGTWTALSPNESAWELTGHFVRGTGRFAGITGRWRERVEWRLSGVTGAWEAAYDAR